MTLACLTGPELGTEALGTRLLADPWSTPGMMWEKGITFPYSKQSCLGTLLRGNLGEGIEGIST